MSILPRHGRTVHSLAKMLRVFDCALVYVAPAGLEMPEVVEAVVAGASATQRAGADLAAEVKEADALYVTRVQKERFPSAEAYDAVRGAYIVDRKALDSAPKDCIVMHPLPRVDEIATDVDADPRAKYFEQMENGMYVRMALLALVLGADLSALPP